MSKMDVGSSGWCGCQPQPWLNHIIWLHKWPRTPKSEPSSSVDIIVWGYCRMPMDSKSMCSDTVYTSKMDAGSSGWGGCQPQLDFLTSFWLHKWPRTPKSEPSSVGKSVYGCFLMPMDSISICSNTVCMSKMDVQSSLWWLSASTMA